MVLGAGTYAMAAMGGGPNQSGVCVGRAEVCGAGSEVRRLLRGSCTLWPRGIRPRAVVLLDLVLCEQGKGTEHITPSLFQALRRWSTHAARFRRFGGRFPLAASTPAEPEAQDEPAARCRASLPVMRSWQAHQRALSCGLSLLMSADLPREPRICQSPSGKRSQNTLPDCGQAGLVVSPYVSSLQNSFSRPLFCQDERNGLAGYVTGAESGAAPIIAHPASRAGHLMLGRT